MNSKQLFVTIFRGFFFANLFVFYFVQGQRLFFGVILVKEFHEISDEATFHSVLNELVPRDLPVPILVYDLHQLEDAGEDHLTVKTLSVHVEKPDHNFNQFININCPSTVFIKYFEDPFYNDFYLLFIIQNNQ